MKYYLVPPPFPCINFKWVDCSGADTDNSLLFGVDEGLPNFPNFYSRSSFCKSGVTRPANRMVLSLRSSPSSLKLDSVIGPLVCLLEIQDMAEGISFLKLGHICYRQLILVGNEQRLHLTSPR